ncbi:MAG: sensor histidine kinase, partial [Paenibacillus sp.]|nr:sensor histidine kinase [Paenibacillus sp.]
MFKRVRDNSKFSIRHQVIYLFFILIVGPFLFIVYFSYNTAVDTIENVSSLVSLDMIDKSGKNLDNYIQLVNNAQNDFMYHADIQELLGRELTNSLEESAFINDMNRLTLKLVTNTHAYSYRLFPLSPTKFIFYSSFFYNGGKVEEQQWFQRAKEKGVPFWELFLPENDPVVLEPTLSLIKRQYNLAAKRIGGI